MGNIKIDYFSTALGGILRSNEKTSHAKFEANWLIFKGGARETKLTMHFDYLLWHFNMEIVFTLLPQQFLPLSNSRNVRTFTQVERY